MNRTLAFIVVGGIVIVSLISVVVILIIRPDVSTTLIGFIGTMTGFILLAYSQLSGQKKLDEKIEQVAKNTNGTNDVLLHAAIKGTPLSLSEISQIKSNAPGTISATEKEL